MITNYTPSAYMVHDQLHIRGGHQVSWLIDGVPVPNTSIASNVGPQFDPKDIDYLEVQRGGFSADYGDRTYGMFNVVTRSGFERDRQGELVLGYGSYNNTNDQISFGDHTERFAYYGSLSGYRTDLGLETSSTDIVHDQAAGLSGFGSIIFNKTPADQFRLVTSLRGDHYQVPIDRQPPTSCTMSKTSVMTSPIFPGYIILETARYLPSRPSITSTAHITSEALTIRSAPNTTADQISWEAWRASGSPKNSITSGPACKFSENAIISFMKS